MEYIQDNIIPSLRTYSMQILQQTISILNNPDKINHLLSTVQSDYLEPYIIVPFADIFDSSVLSTSNILSIVTLIVTLYISLRILDYARRVVMFWVMLVVRLIFWASVLGVGVYVYNVGIEKALSDSSWIWGLVQGFVEDFVSSNGANAGIAGSYERGNNGGGYYGGSYGYGSGRSGSRQYKYRG